MTANIKPKSQPIKPREPYLKKVREKLVNKAGILVCKGCGHPDECHGRDDSCVEFDEFEFNLCSCFRNPMRF